MYLQADIADGAPWYCIRKFGSPPRGWSNSLRCLTLEIEFSGAGCLSTLLEQRTGGAGGHPSRRKIQHHLVPLTENRREYTAAPIYTRSVTCPVELYFTGDDAYLTSACPDDELTLYDTLGGAINTASWTSSTVSAYGAKIAVNDDGQAAIVYKQSKTGFGPIRTLVTVGDGQFAEFDVSPNVQNPILQNTWVVDGAVWASALIGSAQVTSSAKALGLLLRLRR